MKEKHILSGVTYGSKWGRVRKSVVKNRKKTAKSAEDLVREMKAAQKKPPGEDYRDRSLTIHGLICARCGREFDHSNRHLLTVHHKDGNHHYNPPDGSNWENLCVYCHDDIHSREILGDYFDGTAGEKETRLAYKDEKAAESSESGTGSLGEKLRKAMKTKGEINP